MAGLGFARKRDRRNINDYADVPAEGENETRTDKLARHYERRNSAYKHGPGPKARWSEEERRYRRWRERNPRPPESGTPDHYPPYSDEWRNNRREV